LPLAFLAYGLPRLRRSRSLEHVGTPGAAMEERGVAHGYAARPVVEAFGLGHSESLRLRFCM
jgi:hypothetical protein